MANELEARELHRPTETELRDLYGFIPCRFDECERDDIHPKHRPEEMVYGKQAPTWVCRGCLEINTTRAPACKGCGNRRLTKEEWRAAYGRPTRRKRRCKSNQG